MRSNVRSRSTRCGLEMLSIVVDFRRYFFLSTHDKKAMAINFKNFLMGFGLWVVLSFAMHGGDAKKGDVASVKEAKELTDFHEKRKDEITQDGKS